MWSDVALGIVIICGANLFFGIILGFLGYLRYLKHKETIALAAQGIVNEAPSRKSPADPRALRSGLVPMFVGIALCIGLYPIGWIADINTPLKVGPWLLAGIIPFFVGLAILLSHLLPNVQDMVDKGISTAVERGETDQLADSGSIDVQSEQAAHADDIPEMKV